MNHTTLTALCLTLLLGSAVAADDEQTLTKAGIAADGPALVRFFRERTPDDARHARLRQLVGQLGDASFETREQATRELTSAGRAAQGLLQSALLDADAEVAARARRCLDGGQARPELTVTLAAMRLLVRRQPADALPTLLAYLPSVSDRTVEETLTASLRSLLDPRQPAPPSLVAALADREPSRRALAVTLLGPLDAAPWAEMKRLLQDEEPAVRFAAAQALLRREPAAAVPVLIAPLTDAPLPLAWQSEDVLTRLANGRGPDLFLEATDAPRPPVRNAWQRWWQAHAAGFDAAAADPARPLGRTLICEFEGTGKNTAGRVWECDAAGRQRWQLLGLDRPIDAHTLADGRLLIAEYRGRRVSERDRLGRVLWQKTLDAAPICCQRLPDGNTFVATDRDLLELDRDGAVVFSSQRGDQLYHACVADNGQIVVVYRQGAVALINRDGREVGRLAVEGLGGWASVERLADNRYLVAVNGGGRLVEVDRVGQVLWQADVPTPGWATRLANGHTLATSLEEQIVVELDRNGHEVWRQWVPGKPFRARRR